MKTVIFSVALMALGIGCGDDGTVQPNHDAQPLHDASIDAAPPPPCFSGTPTTHEQIINACTSAQQIYKTSNPPLLHADGSLPSLPP
jgi:hypothetical protein